MSIVHLFSHLRVSLFWKTPVIPPVFNTPETPQGVRIKAKRIQKHFIKDIYKVWNEVKSSRPFLEVTVLRKRPKSGLQRRFSGFIFCSKLSGAALQLIVLI
ncbi:hypothetical protein PoMZ_04808 [Pyricularia oryzae]|uniref:Uncharacterized protein n=1 Tax=Pyricularia oryzae TaxID=318829 RepID=A0A4P7NB59_PYROR|nr:hypothetical protein PoMZ_04808 [Pyricularia oryzae]